MGSAWFDQKMMLSTLRRQERFIPEGWLGERWIKPRNLERIAHDAQAAH